jgi:type IV secretion system protein VirB10
MTPTDREPTSEPQTPPSIRDRRLIPRGGLPRQIQTWLMIGVAIVILLIILVTGRPQPLTSGPLPERPQAATLTAPDRIKGFERQLSDDEARLREMADRAAAEQAAFGAHSTGSATGASAVRADRPMDADLSADNVAFSRRPSSLGKGGTPAPAASDPTTQAMSEIDALEGWLKTMSAAMPSAPTPPSAQPATVQPPREPASALSAQAPQSPPVSQAPPEASRTRLLEGTVIEAVLLNRLDGTYSGPVTALVTSPVYSLDRHDVVIPAGARVIGEAAAVQSWGDSRLAIAFHRLMTPDGKTYSLDQFKGLSQIGETGLRDRVNRHYWQVFGASLAVGALSGLAQIGTRSGVNMSFGDGAGQGAGSSLANSATRILDRYLNVLPTVTIREGYRLKVYLTSDLDLPAWVAPSGGVR